MAEYQFTRPMPKGTSPNEVAATINILVEKHGEARPEHVVEIARDPDSPLHACFTWDDTEAARLQRLNEARYVLRAVVVVRENKPDQTVRAFVNVEREGGWRPIDAVIADEGDRSLLLAQALADLKAFTRKYESLEELAPIHETVKAIERSMEDKIAVHKTATSRRPKAKAA